MVFHEAHRLRQLQQRSIPGFQIESYCKPAGSEPGMQAVLARSFSWHRIPCYKPLVAGRNKEGQRSSA